MNGEFTIKMALESIAGLFIVWTEATPSFKLLHKSIQNVTGFTRFNMMKDYPETVVIVKGTKEMKAFIHDITERLKSGETVPVNLQGMIFEVSLNFNTNLPVIKPKAIKAQTLDSGLVFIY
jgi:hypothetical protein